MDNVTSDCCLAHYVQFDSGKTWAGLRHLWVERSILIVCISSSNPKSKPCKQKGSSATGFTSGLRLDSENSIPIFILRLAAESRDWRLERVGAAGSGLSVQFRPGPYD